MQSMQSRVATKTVFAMVVAILAVGLFAQPKGRAAQVAEGQFMAYGPTSQSCGAWTMASANDEKQLYLWWTLGFVSGVDFQRSVHLSTTDSKGIEAWMDKYCAEHPLAPLVRASIDLVTELGAKPGQR